MKYAAMGTPDRRCSAIFPQAGGGPLSRERHPPRSARPLSTHRLSARPPPVGFRKIGLCTEHRALVPLFFARLISGPLPPQPSLPRHVVRRHGILPCVGHDGLARRRGLTHATTCVEYGSFQAPARFFVAVVGGASAAGDAMENEKWSLLDSD